MSGHAARGETTPAPGRAAPGGPAAVRALVAACHPGPTLAVTVVAAALAAGAGRGLAGTAWTAAAVLTGQLSIGWSNDLVDARRDRAGGRTDKPLAAGTLTTRTVALATALAVLACVPLSLANGVPAGTVHLVAVASAWAYNLGLKRTPVSFVPYAVSFGLLPSVATLGLPGHPWAPTWATAGGALLGVAAHLTNVVPDMEDDLAQGVRGLPHRVGATTTLRLAAGLLVAATAVLVVGPPGSPDALAWTGLAAAGGLGAAAALAGPRGRLPFTAVVLVALVDVLLLVGQGAALA